MTNQEIHWTPTSKQKEAFKYLLDNETTELLFGGGAGGGKSYLGCLWLLKCCINYPGTRYLMGRAQLKTLKESTLLTFFYVCKQWGLKSGLHYTYNSMGAVIKFWNGSEIYLKDLFMYPSDPEFDELGSTEFTAAFIDEASQITEKAYQIVRSRIRYRLDEFGLIPKTLIATNPTKNFIYADFYKAAKDGQLQPYKKFVQALAKDNQFISQHYIENLNKLDKISKERLLFGNWEYDDDPSRLFNYEALVQMFTNPFNPTIRPRRYLSVDVARFGDDSTVVIMWNNWFIEKIWASKKQSTLETQNFIEKVRNEYNIPRQSVVVDEDGIGGGIVDNLPGIRGFVNNSSPIEVNLKKNNFANLKSQCYFLLADFVNTNQIGITPDVNIDMKKLIIADLEQIKHHNPDKDEKLRVTPKEELKELLRRSPDFGDAIMMRMIFELKKLYIPYVSALERRK